MVTVRVPTSMKALTGGQVEVQVEATTVAEVIERLNDKYNGIKHRLCDETGNVRVFVNIYVNEEDIRGLDGIESATKSGDEVAIIPAIAGG